VLGMVLAWLLLHRFRVGWLERAALDHLVAAAIVERRGETPDDELRRAVGDPSPGEPL